MNVTLTRDPDDEEDDEPAAQGVRKVHPIFFCDLFFYTFQLSIYIFAN